VNAAGFGRIVENPDPDRGQLSSLVTGLDTFDRSGVNGVLVTLVDVPLITASTVAALLGRTAASPAPILRATYRGRHGHPVVFMRAVFAALRAADPAAGAKPLMRAFAVEDFETADPGVVLDVDTPDDYARLAT
jgi:CTP:molybdopterin cytidylyltransferase MocA